jgi:predicted glycosyltransferase involved in capsule biosynthesis
MKVDLRDTTFLIPVNYDHRDRKDNLDLLLKMITKIFDTNIIVGEQGGRKFEYVSKYVTYMNFDYKDFHRTKMLNEMAKASKTPIIVNQDVDCHVVPAAMLRAVDMIRRDEADFVYPYQYLFVRVKKEYHQDIHKHYDLAAVGHIKRGVDTKSRPSLGGIVLFNREKFLANGGENEAFVSYSPEDLERYERFKMLDLRCRRVRGHLYHLEHFKGVNSTTANPHYEAGVQELLKIRDMTRQELIEYVNSWQR